jgi:undecaprenyl phosphate-alpha-L-ara4N flippase subunit ArnE
MKIVESLKRNKIGIIFILFASIFICIGQLFWKISADEYSILYLCEGFILYAIGTVFMFTAYRFGKMSVLQPMLSMNYVFSAIIAVKILNENISPLKLIGIIIITMSVVLIGGSDD